MKLSKLLLIIILFNSISANTSLPFDKVIIWGYKLHSHTHSYVHNGFYRAFKHLGYDTYWFDDKDTLNNFDFKNSLFVTIGGQDEKIPLRDDCRYILHNCEDQKYKPLFDQGNCIALQVYTHDCLARKVKKIDNCIYHQIEDKAIYIPWATDLLPHEIEANKELIKQVEKENTVYWIGSIWGTEHGNWGQLSRFVAACKDNNIKFQKFGDISLEKHGELIQKSIIAPAIQGEYQCEKGYIPCRIFKNISYGHMGVTNSKAVYELFERKIIYNPDCYQLFFDAYYRSKNVKTSELHELMNMVINKHTYINRINTLLDFMHLIKPIIGY